MSSQIADIARVMEKTVEEVNELIALAPQKFKPRKRRPLVVQAGEVSEPSAEEIYDFWQIVTGPTGESIYFRFEYYKSGSRAGQLKKMIRVKTTEGEDPITEVGSLIMDLRGGVKVWRKVKSRKRRPYPMTPQMKEAYESSVLYKARKLAAGKYARNVKKNVEKFLNDIKGTEKFKKRIKKRKK
jgi:hypothetical protein